MNKKAISPLIATVLIIGFTIVLAAVVLQWAGGFVKNLTAEQEKTVNLQTACMGLDLQITSAVLTKTIAATESAPEVPGNFVVKLANNNADKTIAGALVLVETSTERITLDDEKDLTHLNVLNPLESATWKATEGADSNIPTTLGTFAVDSSLIAKLVLTSDKTFTVGNKVIVIPQVSVGGETKSCDIGVAATATITAA